MKKIMHLNAFMMNTPRIIQSGRGPILTARSDLPFPNLRCGRALRKRWSGESLTLSSLQISSPRMGITNNERTKP